MMAALDWRTAPVPFIAGLGDTRLETAQPYAVRPLGELMASLTPYSVPKNRAPAFLPSLYAANDARSHAAQKERGRFIALVGDIDEGDCPLGQVEAAVDKLGSRVARTIYSTASAHPEGKRWRLIVPLGSALSYDDWRDAQLALVDHMAAEGIKLDTCAARPGQISYLPNVPKDARAPDGEPWFFECASSDLDAPGLAVASGAIAGRIEAIRERRIADDRERERIKAEAFTRRAHRPITTGQGGSMIEAFNRHNSVATLLERYGYTRSPRHGEDWRSPMQTSDSFATRLIEGDKWISLSGSDAAAGLGERCSAGCFGDAFDLFAFFEHGNDRRAALRELHREQEAVSAPDMRHDREDPEMVDPVTGEVALPIGTLDLQELATRQPTPKAFAIAGVAPLGEVTLFTGAGSAGKSLLGQQIATCAAAGVRCLGLDVLPAPSLYVTCEDDPDQLHLRQAQICSALNVPMASLAGALHLASLRGALDNPLCSVDQAGVLTPSPTFHRLARMAKLTGVRIVILDNVAHLFTGNENDRGEVTQFVNLLNRLAGETGAAILLIGHPNKGGDTYSGSTAWLNAVRSQVFLQHDLDTDLRTLTVGKANYARKGDAVRFLWVDGAFMREQDLPADRAKELENVIRAANDDDLFLACLRERNKQQRAVSESKGTNYAPNVFARMPEARGCSKQRLEDAMDRLFREGRIERGELPWKSRERHTAIGLRETAANGAAN